MSQPWVIRNKETAELQILVKTEKKKRSPVRENMSGNLGAKHPESGAGRMSLEKKEVSG